MLRQANLMSSKELNFVVLQRLSAVQRNEFAQEQTLEFHEGKQEQLEGKQILADSHFCLPRTSTKRFHHLAKDIWTNEKIILRIKQAFYKRFLFALNYKT